MLDKNEKPNCSLYDEESSRAFHLLALAFFFACATYCFKTIVSRVGFPSLESPVSAIIYLYWILNVISFFKIKKTLTKKLLVFEGIYLTIMMLNYFIFPKSLNGQTQNVTLPTNAPTKYCYLSILSY